MAVVINEFEVEPAPAPPPSPAAAASGGGEIKPSEHEIQRLVEHKISREERVWAH